MARVSLRHLLVLIAFCTSIIALQTPVEQAAALNGFIDPNGDGSTGNWNTTGLTYFSEIDEAIRQPNIPNTIDNVSASANNGGSLNMRMGTVIGAVLTSDITVWIYHNDGSNGQITVQLFDDNETTQRSNSAVLTQSATNAWHSVTFSGLSLTQLELNTLTVRMTAGKNGGGQPATIRVHAMYADVTYSSIASDFQQSAYRWFASINSTDVGAPLAGQDTATVLNAGGDEFRLRMLLHVTGANLAQNGRTFKLQFVDRGSGSCASPSGGTPATYTDVTTGTVMAYNNLTSGVSDGDPLTANVNDPSHSGHTVRNQTVEEANDFSNTQSAINVGEDGLWDFALIDNGAPAATTYCFRAVETNGTLLNTYSQYPQITTGNGTLTIDIVDSVGAPVASPSFSMSTAGYLFTCDTSSTTLGTTSQRIEVSNNTGTASWSTSIAATAGNTAQWSDGATNTYDFNESAGTPNGCTDGPDADSIAGQLRLNPSVGTSTPRTGCTNTGINLGSNSAFSEGVTDAITLFSANSTAELGCSWQLTDVPTIQQLPADQAAGNYSINLTITVTAI